MTRLNVDDLRRRSTVVSDGDYWVMHGPDISAPDQLLVVPKYDHRRPCYYCGRYTFGRYAHPDQGKVSAVVVLCPLCFKCLEADPTADLVAVAARRLSLDLNDHGSWVEQYAAARGQEYVQIVARISPQILALPPVETVDELLSDVSDQLTALKRRRSS
jgi:hypothetical protein